MCALLLPRVRPTIAPRAYISQRGAPRPVNADTRYTPPLSGTLSARMSHSCAVPIRPSSSRSHWIELPALNTLPSSAYVVLPLTDHATLVTRPLTLRTDLLPVFMSVKQPVPYVFFA